MSFFFAPGRLNRKGAKRIIAARSAAGTKQNMFLLRALMGVLWQFDMVRKLTPSFFSLNKKSYFIVLLRIWTPRLEKSSLEKEV